MIKFHLKSAFRNLIRNKFYSGINILGLAIGITACVLTMLYVQFEFSHDKYHENYERIYRVNLITSGSNYNDNWPYSSDPLAGIMKDEIPEVEDAVRVTKYRPLVIEYNNKIFNETKWSFVDANFFNFFTTSFIYGDPGLALTEPFTVVLTESTAKRYFGDQNPLGRTLSQKDRNDYVVTGVIKDFPSNSHYKPDFLASIKSIPAINGTNWLLNIHHTYVLLKQGASKAAVDAKLAEIVKKYVGPYMKQVKGVSLEESLAKGNKYEYYTQPLSDIYFNRDVILGPEASGSKSYIIIISIIAIFILANASINYMNLSTANSTNRAKEVGIKKSLGSNRKNLIIQFLSESLLFTFLALIIALILIKTLLPFFNNLIDKELTLSYTDNLITLPLLLVFGLIIAIISGSYPAFFLASFKPVTVMSGTHKTKGALGNLRSGLVVVQLIVTIILFAGTFCINKQLDLFQNKEMGYNKENLVILKNVHHKWINRSAFTSEILTQPGILEASNSTHIPGRCSSGNLFFHDTKDNSKGMNQLWVDADFLKAYQIELLQGRFFEEGNDANSKSIVICESALKELGLEDPIGKKIYKRKKTEEGTFTIIGVIKDLHLHPLHQDLSSVVLLSNANILKARGSYLSVRISGDIQKNLKTIEHSWDKYAGGQPFEYTFFDEDFGRFYKAEVQTKSLASILSIITIFIANLGLLALAAFVAEQRIKEIGIRKVNGAKVSEILVMLNRDFIKWVAIAFVVACPIAYYAMTKWLENFAYKINLSWSIFASAGVLALVIAVITVSWRSWSAATKNPVQALRYE
ncbi:ABC transporter permease [Puteibacter caeruleilacunae]|nr:ABC transporter permease [Puteibacter caeruleilacunae]